MNSTEKKSAFSVNLSLTDEDLFKVKKIIQDLIKDKAETTVVSYYRPEAHQVVSGGLILQGAFKIENPDKEDFGKVLDLIKNVEERNEGEKTKTLITVTLPIINMPTGKKE